jgi:hypothetical protein
MQENQKRNQNEEREGEKENKRKDIMKGINQERQKG